MHQLAGGIVDVDQQAAPGAAPLEPVVVGAVDLDQLAAPVASVAGLVQRRALGGLGSPQACRHHDLAKRLVRQRDAVAVGKVLRGQGRAEVRIPLPHEAGDLIPKGIAEAPVTRAATLARDETGRAILLQPLQQPVNLATLEPEQHHRVRDPDLATLDPHQGLEPGSLRNAHRQHRHQRTSLFRRMATAPGDPPARVVPVLFSGSVPFERCAYTSRYAGGTIIGIM